MGNNKSVRIIDTKTIGNIEYRLIKWISNDLFIIDKFDKGIMGCQARRVVFRSHNENKARDYFKNLE